MHGSCMHKKGSYCERCAHLACQQPVLVLQTMLCDQVQLCLSPARTAPPALQMLARSPVLLPLVQNCVLSQHFVCAAVSVVTGYAAAAAKLCDLPRGRLVFWGREQRRAAGQKGHGLGDGRLWSHRHTPRHMRRHVATATKTPTIDPPCPWPSTWLICVGVPGPQHCWPTITTQGHHSVLG